MGFDALSWQVIWLHKKDIDMIGRDRRIQVVDSIINGLNYKNKKKNLVYVWSCGHVYFKFNGEERDWVSMGGPFFFSFFFLVIRDRPVLVKLHWSIWCNLLVKVFFFFFWVIYWSFFFFIFSCQLSERNLLVRLTMKFLHFKNVGLFFFFGLSFVQWPWLLDLSRYRHISNLGYVSVIQCVQWHWPLDRSWIFFFFFFFFF